MRKSHKITILQLHFSFPKRLNRNVICSKSGLQLSVHTLERCLEFLIRVWQQSTVPPASQCFTEGPYPLWAKRNSNTSSTETVAWEHWVVVFLGLAYGPCLLRRVTLLSFWDIKPYCSNWYHDKALPNDMRAECSFVSITL